MRGETTKAVQFGKYEENNLGKYLLPASLLGLLFVFLTSRQRD